MQGKMPRKKIHAKETVKSFRNQQYYQAQYE